MMKYCSAPFTTISVHNNGEITSCLCAGWHKYRDMGNLNRTDLKDIFVNDQFNDFRSSIVDQSFEHCIKEECPKLWNLEEVEDFDIIGTYPGLPTVMNVQIDSDCNLKCPSCRHAIQWSNEANPRAEEILDRLVKDYQNFEHDVWFQCDGTGDVFASRAYQNFFKRDDLPKCFKFNLTTNGNLVTKNLDVLEKIKSQIFSVCVSFDAANAETYKKIRGGKFELIVAGVKAMKEMGILRVNTSFVTQKGNYLEILDYYNLCKELGINHIGISKMDRWTHMDAIWWSENKLDNNKSIDYKFLVNALNTIKEDPTVGMCGGLYSTLEKYSGII